MYYICYRMTLQSRSATIYFRGDTVSSLEEFSLVSFLYRVCLSFSWFYIYTRDTETYHTLCMVTLNDYEYTHTCMSICNKKNSL